VVIFSVLIVCAILLIPITGLNAETSNPIKNGDFEMVGDPIPDWTEANGLWLIEESSENHYAKIILPQTIGGTNYLADELVQQNILASNPNLDFSYDIWIKNFITGSHVRIVLFFFEGSNYQFSIDERYTVATGIFEHKSYSILQKWNEQNPGIPIKNFDNIWIDLLISAASNVGELDVRFDNLSLSLPSETAADPVWIRTQEMTCKRVWINEEGKFQFSFIYPYRDNNWVKIYDMSGKEVFVIDIPYDNPNIIVDLPDGMYTVKTFHDQPEPLQTFIIGKP